MRSYSKKTSVIIFIDNLFLICRSNDIILLFGVVVAQIHFCSEFDLGYPCPKHDYVPNPIWDQIELGTSWIWYTWCPKPDHVPN